MFSGSNTAPQKRQTLLVALAISALSLGFSAAGCGGGGGGGNNNGGGGSTNQLAVTGRLVDASTSTSSPVSGATLTLNGQTQTTASDGSFTFTYTSAQAAATMKITPPSGTSYYARVTTASTCTDALTLSVGAVTTANTPYNLGTVNLYSATSAPPQFPCGILPSSN